MSAEVLDCLQGNLYTNELQWGRTCMSAEGEDGVMKPETPVSFNGAALV